MHRSVFFFRGRLVRFVSLAAAQQFFFLSLTHTHMNAHYMPAVRIHILQNEGSMLTFEGEQFQGSPNILNKLRAVGKVVHEIKSMDVQPSATGNALVIFVTGSVRIGDANSNPLHFCEMFQLVSTGPNAYYGRLYSLIEVADSWRTTSSSSLITCTFLSQSLNNPVHNDVFRLNYGL